MNIKVAHTFIYKDNKRCSMRQGTNLMVRGWRHGMSEYRGGAVPAAS